MNCPKCNSLAITARKSRNIVMDAEHYALTCKECGHKWSAMKFFRDPDVREEWENVEYINIDYEGTK